MSLFFFPPPPPPGPLPRSSSSSPFDPQLPPLSSIYLQPLSHSSSVLAQSSPTSLTSALASKLGRIVRTGDVISVPPASSAAGGAGEILAFRVVMTEPVLMGVIVLQEDQEGGREETEIIVGPSSSSSSLQPPPPSNDARRRNPSPSSLSDTSSDRTIQPLHPDSDPDEDEEDDDEDTNDFEISASFLQQALLGPSPSSSSSNNNLTNSTSSSPAFSLASLTSDYPRLVPKALERPLRSRSTRESRGEEEIAWVRTRVLGEVGAFDGDWVSQDTFSIEMVDGRDLD